MDRQKWIIGAIVVVITIIAAAIFWPSGGTQMGESEPSTTEQPAEPTQTN